VRRKDGTYSRSPSSLTTSISIVRVWPTDSGAAVVKECNGVTSYALRREFPSLLTLPSMWTRSYFCSTAGTVSQATIQVYIDAQKGLR